MVEGTKSKFVGDYTKDFDTWCNFYDPDQEELKIVLKNWNPQNQSTCEIGCGTGRFTFQIAPLVKKCIAVDVSRSMIKYCKQKLKNKYSNLEDRLFFVVADARALPFADKTFDALFDMWTFSSTSLGGKGLETARDYSRILKDQGNLVVIAEGNESEYQDILLNFVPKGYSYKVEEEVEEPLLKIFGGPQKKQELKIPYVFENMRDALDSFMFNLEEYLRLKIKQQDKQLLRRLIDGYKRDTRVEIMEAAIFYLFTKPELLR